MAFHMFGVSSERYICRLCSVSEGCVWSTSGGCVKSANGYVQSVNTAIDRCMNTLVHSVFMY